MRWGEHRRWERAVEQLVDGELSAQRVVAVHVHVRDCPDCAAQAAVMLAVRASLRRRAWGLPPLSPRRRRRLVELWQEGFADL